MIWTSRLEISIPSHCGEVSNAIKKINSEFGTTIILVVIMWISSRRYLTGHTDREWSAN